MTVVLGVFFLKSWYSSLADLHIFAFGACTLHARIAVFQGPASDTFVHIISPLLLVCSLRLLPL